MKKLFFLLSFVTIISSSAFAGAISRPGLIALKPVCRIIPIPDLRPLSLTDDPFTLFATESQLILTSETVNSNVSLWIVDNIGTVYSASETMSIGSEIIIDVENLNAGSYTLYINICNSNDEFYATFEIN